MRKFRLMEKPDTTDRQVGHLSIVLDPTMLDLSDEEFESGFDGLIRYVFEAIEKNRDQFPLGREALLIVCSGLPSGEHSRNYRIRNETASKLVSFLNGRAGRVVAEVSSSTGTHQFSATEFLIRVADAPRKIGIYVTKVKD